MDFSIFSSLDFMAIIVASIAYWVLGMLWYAPFLFGNIWAAEVGISEVARKKMAMSMILSFIGMFLSCTVLALFVTHLVAPDMLRGIKIAVAAGFAFTFIPMWIARQYQQSSLKALFIDAFYHIFGYVLASVIITTW